MTISNDMKATLCGAVATAASLITLTPDHFGLAPWAVSLAAFVFAGGLAGLGIVCNKPDRQPDGSGRAVDGRPSA